MMLPTCEPWSQLLLRQWIQNCSTLLPPVFSGCTLCASEPMPSVPCRGRNVKGIAIWGLE